MSLIGPRGHVAERLAAFAEAGVTTLNATPLGGSTAERVARWRRWSSSPPATSRRSQQGVHDFVMYDAWSGSACAGPHALLLHHEHDRST